MINNSRSICKAREIISYKMYTYNILAYIFIVSNNIQQYISYTFSFVT